MMAKMFYTLDEAKTALGKNEEEIKQYSREGRLREFRDGPRLMYKADQVETLKAELGGGGGGSRDQVDLGVSDTGAPIGLVDSQRGNTGSMISLVDSEVGSGSGIGSGGLSSGLGGSRAGGGALKDDTALAADLGLSGSMGGVPSPGRPGSGSMLGGTRGGINVLGDTGMGDVDPGAQTAINSSVSDQVNLEGVGSGSGLLDLTRESDDTSLGAELLDEIQPGGSRRGSGTAVAVGGSSVGGTAGGTAITTATSTAAARRAGGAVTFVEAPDALASAFGGACLAASVMMILSGIALFSAVLGTRPTLLEKLNDMSFVMLALVGAGAALVFFIFGLFIGKARS